MFHELTDHFHVAADVGRSWAFFSDAGNLPAITPPWLGFTMLTKPPIEMKQDTLLDYTIRWKGVPLHWRTKIIDWSPPHQFIDLQIMGPYSLWHHQHRFEPSPDGNGTICFDRVIYKVPGGPLGKALHAMMIRRQLFDIFRFRRKAIGERLGWVRAVQEDIAIRSV